GTVVDCAEQGRSEWVRVTGARGAEKSTRARSARPAPRIQRRKKQRPRRKPRPDERSTGPSDARVSNHAGVAWTCASFVWPRLSSWPLLFFSLDPWRGSCRTNPRRFFRASCAGHPYPFASSLFCDIHRSAASMSESCAAVIPGMRPPPASCLTRASSVDDTVLTQVSPRRTLLVNFWDFSSVISTPRHLVAGRNIAPLTISRQNFRECRRPRRQAVMGNLIERNSRCLIDIVELLALGIHVKEAGQEFTFFQAVLDCAAGRGAVGGV